MLQNRVDPWGNIIRTPARGAWMGNRGLLHDEHKNIRRAFKLKAWITCVLAFKERRRTVMLPNRYTELFFLDEATAFAAGHRPCFECRRQDAIRFRSCWVQGNPQYALPEKVAFPVIDNILHAERINKAGEKILHEDSAGDLPDGCFILWQQQPCLVAGDWVYPWTPAGYLPGLPRPVSGQVTVLTPASVVNAFQAGYTPQMALQPSAL
ncbi:hypothetical protein [Chitinophaga nivalis]|uniref:Uncharacterized protein n=1 Tax=Chitinophaga nivalis TaxID=2991709 RepID=A0ABT3IPB7_9BACT|nr:hypothetical protein [Chitinophaga nivalis]MCW3464521.1 hypothetical protein [Chitinophaga nivalis]MCW3485788.1 hypothetical protein [Chitinophaga nivalis]